MSNLYPDFPFVQRILENGISSNSSSGKWNINLVAISIFTPIFLSFNELVLEKRGKLWEFIIPSALVCHLYSEFPILPYQIFTLIFHFFRLLETNKVKSDN